MRTRNTQNSGSIFSVHSRIKPAKANKKASVEQIFVFMLAIFLAALILIFGYRMISKFMEDIRTTATIDFQTKLEGGIKKMATKFNSVEILELQVPGDYEKVCILEPGYSNPKTTNICGGPNGDANGDFDKEKDFDMALCNLWPTQIGQENVFLLPLKESLGIKTGPIKIDNGNVVSSSGYICMKPVRGRIALRLEGKGDHTVVSKWNYATGS